MPRFAAVGAFIAAGALIVLVVFGGLAHLLESSGYVHESTSDDRESIFQTMEPAERTIERSTCTFRTEFSVRTHQDEALEATVDMKLIGRYPGTRAYPIQPDINSERPGHYRAFALFDCAFTIDSVSTYIESEGYIPYATTEPLRSGELYEVVLRKRL